MNEPISGFVVQLLALFDGPLRDVRFPDADGEHLATLMSEVEQAQANVSEASAALDAARATLAEKQAMLQQRAERALAYARVYAADRAELSAELNRVAPPRRGPGRPVGAKSKKATAATSAGGGGVPADQPPTAEEDMAAE